MMNLRKHHNIYKIKEEWLKLNAKNSKVNIFQTWDIQKNIYLNLPIYCIQDRAIPIYYEVIDNDETVMIIPLLKVKDRLTSIDSFNGCAYYDFIYADISISQCIK